MVRLDPDPNYAYVAFPTTVLAPRPKLCLIGATRRYDLKVCPPQSDFVANTSTPRSDGLVVSTDATLESKYTVGTMVNPNCQVLHIEKKKQKNNTVLLTFFVAPKAETHTNIFFTQPTRPIIAAYSGKPKPKPVSDTWNPALGRFVTLESGDERQNVLNMFFSSEGGMSRDTHEIVSIQGIQIKSMWDEFAKHRELVADDYWSNPNDEMLFHGTGTHDPTAVLGTASSAASFYWATAQANRCIFSRHANVADLTAYTNGEIKKIVISTVALGRVFAHPNTLPSPLQYHSSLRPRNLTNFQVSVAHQAYPEYVVTYKMVNRPIQQFVLRSPEANANSTTSAGTPGTPTTATTKQCVVCMERPVRKILVPCGHACLCEHCSSGPQLAALHFKCPECRQQFSQAMRFFGTLVEQDEA